MFSSDGTFHKIGILRYSQNVIDDDDDDDDDADDDDDDDDNDNEGDDEDCNDWEW